jgi:hypothetical protein
MRWRAARALLLGLTLFAGLGAAACGGGGDAGGGAGGGDADAAAHAEVALPDDAVEDAGVADDGHGTKPDAVRPDAGGADAAPPPDVPAPPPCTVGEPCDDGDPCTADDACVAGACVGTPHPCDDGLDCTADVCDGAGGCSFVLRGGRCLIDGVCRRDGDAHPEDVCRACLPPLATDAWSPGPAVPCDDGDACTVGDTCRDGVCRPGAPADCGEDNPCVVAGCDPATGCTSTDRDGAVCSDGDPCTLGDVCDGGACQAGPGTLACDDGNACTDDVCQPGVGCRFADTTAPCDDGDPCTTGETCQGGACVATGGPRCDDGNECTDDACQPGVGCVHVNNVAGCDDGDPCSLGDRCVVGSCRPGPARPDCDDGNGCTDDVCTPFVGCEHPANTNPCDDGDLCTDGDVCAGGACQPGPAVDCGDDDVCTTDICDPQRGCLNDPNQDPCDDGDPCTVGDRCTEGACRAGAAPLSCDDHDPCTNDWCLAAEGCRHDPQSGVPCEDGDPCTVGDYCASGACFSGGARLDCEDGNDCTADYCQARVGCRHTPRDSGPCDDRSVCTESDRCVAGQCTGDRIACIDGNPCTADECDPTTGCFYPARQTIECWPAVGIWPARGSTIDGSGQIEVWGTAVGLGAPLASLIINGEPVAVDPATGAFRAPMAVSHGMNLIRLEAEDELGSRRELRQSFYASDTYWPMDPTNWDTSRVPAGIQFFLSDQVIDDGDRSDLDDLGSIFELLIASFDLNALIPRPAARQRVDMGLWNCDYDIYVNNITYARPRVSLTPGAGTLRVVVLIDNFRAEVDANGRGWECPNIDATVTASRITVDTTVALALVDGAVTATVVSNDVTISGLNVRGGNFLTDFILGFFEDSIRDELESAFEDEIGELVPELLGDALGQLALHQDFSIPPFLPGQLESTVTLDSRMGSFSVAGTGILVGLDTVIRGPDRAPYELLGSIARGTCSGTEEPGGGPPPIRRTHNLELALHDDVLNQILYSVWAAGTFEIPVTAEQLGQDLSAYGIESLDLDISFLLPPIAEWCDPDAPLLLQIGDIGVHATFVLLGQPLTVEMYASLEAEGGVELAEGDDGVLELALAIDAIRFIEVDIASVNIGYEDFIPILRDMVEQQLLPSILGGLEDGALGSFPIPAIDLSGFDPSIPPGTGIAIAPEEIWRQSGFTAIGGDMQSSGK